MSEKMVITISREYGSGGRAIGRKLADRLGIDFVDRDILAKLVDESYSIEEAQAKLLASRNSIVKNIYAALGFAAPSETKDFEEQAAKIREIAENRSCVFVGRCADYILSGMPGVTSVFFYSSMEERIRRAMKEQNISKSEAKVWITTTDSTRRGYYNRQTGRLWGDAVNYHLSLDTANMTEEEVVDFIISYIEIKNRK